MREFIGEQRIVEIEEKQSDNYLSRSVIFEINGETKEIGIKIAELLRMLMDNSSEKNPVSADDIVKHLGMKWGLIRHNITQLRRAGFRVLNMKGALGRGYYLPASPIISDLPTTGLPLGSHVLCLIDAPPQKDERGRDVPSLGFCLTSGTIVATIFDEKGIATHYNVRSIIGVAINLPIVQVRQVVSVETKTDESAIAWARQVLALARTKPKNSNGQSGLITNLN